MSKVTPLMSFRVKQTGSDVANYANQDQLKTYDLRYVISTIVAFSKPEHLRLFLIFLMVVHPYPSFAKYTFHTEANPVPTDASHCLEWTKKMFPIVFGSPILEISELPSTTHWGPIWWRFLLALPSDNSIVLSFLTSIVGHILPCEECRAHYTKYIEQTPPEFPCGSWLLTLRNAIRARVASNPKQLSEIGSTWVFEKPSENSLVRISSSRPRLFGSSPSVKIPRGFPLPRKGCACKQSVHN